MERINISEDVGRYFCAQMPCSPADCTGVPCRYLRGAIDNRNNRTEIIAEAKAKALREAGAFYERQYEEIRTWNAERTTLESWHGMLSRHKQERAAILADQAPETTCHRCGGTREFMGDPCTCTPIPSPEAGKVDGPQVGDIVAMIDTSDGKWYPRHWCNISAFDERCLKDGSLRVVVLMRRAEVERRIHDDA